jgi:hypothetical protein
VIAASITILYIRQPFALTFGLAFGVALVAISLKIGSAGNRAILVGLGMTSTLYAVLDIKSDILDRPELMSDARMLAELTGIPTVAWGFLWIGLALAFCGFLFRWAWREAS